MITDGRCLSLSTCPVYAASLIVRLPSSLFPVGFHGDGALLDWSDNVLSLAFIAFTFIFKARFGKGN